MYARIFSQKFLEYVLFYALWEHVVTHFENPLFVVGVPAAVCAATKFITMPLHRQTIKRFTLLATKTATATDVVGREECALLRVHSRHNEAVRTYFITFYIVKVILVGIWITVVLY